MTVVSLMAILLDGILLVAALGTGSREWLIAALGVGVFLAFALLSLLLGVFTLRFSGTLTSGQVTRGEEVTYTLRVGGVALLPVAGHITLLPPGVRDRAEGRRLRRAFVIVPLLSRGERQFAFTVPCPHRGAWTVSPETLRLQDVFGLFSVPVPGVRRRSVAASPLRVLPRVHPLPEQTEIAATVNGTALTHSRSAAGGELLGDTRLWQPGDTTRRIHWKQTGRTQQLYIRQFEDQENPQVLLVLDLTARSGLPLEEADIAVEILVSLAWNALERGRRVSVMPVRGGGDMPPMLLQDEREFPRLIQQAVDWAFIRGRQPLELWQLSDPRCLSAGEIRVITDQPSGQLLQCMGALPDRGYRVSCLLPAPEGESGVPAEPDGLPAVVISADDQIPGKVGMSL